MRVLLALLGSFAIAASLALPAIADPAPPAAPPVLSSAAQGRKLYLKLNCYGCHGMHGYGTMGPNIARQGDIVEALRGGGAQGMPSYAKLVSIADIIALSAYLQSIGTPAEPAFLRWWEAVPSQ